VSFGTWAGAGLITGAHARFGTAVLGIALALYAITGLVSLRFSIAASLERWLGPAAGALTGLITAATGVFVIPAVPYLAAIGLEKEELIQALGLSFTVSTMALALNLAVAGALNVAVLGTIVGAVLMALAGMWIGQALRLRLRPAIFQRWFFGVLLVLGLYLVARSLAEIHEPSPPTISASGRRRCRAASRVAPCFGADLSIAANPARGSVPARWCVRRHRSPMGG
jgi:uncharacterized protein